jgi:hypothetical protein
MINMLHTASAPGLRDTLNPVQRRRRLRLRRRDARVGRTSAPAPVLTPRP